jgi:hypothetical protein
MKRLSRILLSAFLAFAPSFAIAQVLGDVNGAPSGFRGRVQAQGNIPVVSSCGTTPSIAAGSTDWVGEVTTGTGTPAACTITFATPFNAAPFCRLVWKSGPLAAMSWTVSATAITVTQTATNSTVIGYNCIGKSGG